MARELRITLVIMAVALVVCAPLIFAAPGPANTNYLAAVFHIVPPTPVPTLTSTPTLTPAPTNTPQPTLTPTDIVIDIPPIQPPCDRNAPSAVTAGVQVWMTVPEPSRFTQTTVCARYIIGTVVDRGAILEATAHYKTTDTDLGAAGAGNDGVAHITFNIGGATLNYPVTVDGTMGGHPFSTTFTPR